MEPLNLDFLQSKISKLQLENKSLGEEQDRTEEVERAEIAPSCWCTGVFGGEGIPELSTKNPESH